MQVKMRIRAGTDSRARRRHETKRGLRHMPSCFNICGRREEAIIIQKPAPCSLGGRKSERVAGW
jgi:hypothetical protein